MKKVRIVLAVLALLGFMLVATPSRAQDLTPQQTAATLAVNLGYITFQAHILKENPTPNDTKIENLMQQIMQSYSEKLENVTLRDLQNGNLPEFEPNDIQSLTTALIANQKEFSPNEIDISTAKETTNMFLQQLISSLVMLQ